MSGLCKPTEKGVKEGEVMWNPKKNNYVIWKLFLRVDGLVVAVSLLGCL
jgi:hypothetical protein